MFTTERLVLRPWRESDLDEMHAMWNEVGVQLGAGAGHVVPRGLKWRETYRRWVCTTPLSPKSPSHLLFTVGREPAELHHRDERRNSFLRRAHQPAR